MELDLEIVGLTTRENPLLYTQEILTRAPRMNGGATSDIQMGTAARIMKAPAPAKNRNTKNMAMFWLPAMIAPERRMRRALCR